MNPELMQQLADIHTPPPVSWWPPAPGWWLLAALVLVVTVAVIAVWRRRRQRLQLHREACRELQRIRADFEVRHDTQALIRALSAMLRRTAISLGSSESVAGLTGEDWLRWLDMQWERDDFAQGAGRALIEWPYRQIGNDVDVAPLLDLVSDWVQQVTRRRHV